MEFKDYYQILGAERSTDQKEIKKAYRRLARKYHPDLNPGNDESERKFKEINEAYEVLGDPEKRKRYDELGSAWNSYGQQDTEQFWNNFNQKYGQQQAEPAGYTTTHQTTGEEGGDFSDFFQAFFGDIFHGSRSARSPRYQSGSGEVFPRQERKVRSTYHEIEVSFPESQKGTTRNIRVELDEPCVQCGGTGQNSSSRKCPVCEGRGSIRRRKTVNVNIPAGVRDGAKLRVPGVLGGQDLYLQIKVQPHPFFQREEDNVILELPLTVYESILGTELEVPTLTGKATMKIPSETQNGTVFRLRGLGFQKEKSGEKGDQLVKIRVLIPRELTDQEKKYYQELSSMRQENPRKYLMSS
ncbi:MAG: DnaJ C-terminal domain-containing protein [Atribacterota bacterium]